VELRVGGLRLYRDVHYTDSPGGARAAHGVKEPVRLGPGEYFVLGDNSPNSYDSRCWPSSPTVRHEWLVGKPFLVHLPSRLVEWRPFGAPQALAVPDWDRVKLLP
jgi:hypothetical protein